MVSVTVFNGQGRKGLRPAVGCPLWISCIDPRAFALHKLWISKEDSRDPQKKRRDEGQANAVAEVARDYLGLKFEAKDLTALPIELISCSKDLAAKRKTRRKK